MNKFIIIAILSLSSLCVIAQEEKINHDKFLYSILFEDIIDIKEWIDKGANVSYQNSPLRIGTLHACLVRETENIAILELLLNKGANVNMQNSEGSTPLIQSVVKNRVKSIKMLMKYGAKTDIKDRYGLEVKDYLNGENDTLIINILIQN